MMKLSDKNRNLLRCFEALPESEQREISGGRLGVYGVYALINSDAVGFTDVPISANIDDNDIRAYLCDIAYIRLEEALCRAAVAYRGDLADGCDERTVLGGMILNDPIGSYLNFATCGIGWLYDDLLSQISTEELAYLLDATGTPADVYKDLGLQNVLPIDAIDYTLDIVRRILFSFEMKTHQAIERVPLSDLLDAFRSEAEEYFRDMFPR